jgi:hypothetical protein
VFFINRGADGIVIVATEASLPARSAHTYLAECVQNEDLENIEVRPPTVAPKPGFALLQQGVGG